MLALRACAFARGVCLCVHGQVAVGRGWRAGVCARAYIVAGEWAVDGWAGDLGPVNILEVGGGRLVRVMPQIVEIVDDEMLVCQLVDYLQQTAVPEDEALTQRGAWRRTSWIASETAALCASEYISQSALSAVWIAAMRLRLSGI